jgi:hypothetical protein
VHSSTITVEFFNTSTTVPVRALVFPYDIDLITSLPLAIDDPFVESKYARIANISIAGGGHDSRSITSSVSVASLEGVKKVDATNALLSGYTGSSNSSTAYSQPQDRWQWYVSCSTVTGANLGTAQVFIAVKVTQVVEFFQRLPKGY